MNHCRHLVDSVPNNRETRASTQSETFTSCPTLHCTQKHPLKHQQRPQPPTRDDGLQHVPSNKRFRMDGRVDPCLPMSEVKACGRSASRRWSCANTPSKQRRHDKPAMQQERWIVRQGPWRGRRGPWTTKQTPQNKTRISAQLHCGYSFVLGAHFTSCNRHFHSFIIIYQS
jgi:hypothetical protein